jgi:hypothetical protein
MSRYTIGKDAADLYKIKDIEAKDAEIKRLNKILELYDIKSLTFPVNDSELLFGDIVDTKGPTNIDGSNERVRGGDAYKKNRY